MKNLILASAIVALSAVSVQAEGGLMSLIKPDASLQYGFKTKKWSGDMGATATLGRVSIRPALDWSYSSSTSIGVDGASVKSTMPFGSKLSAFSKLSLDGSFKYEDLAIGIELSF